MNEKIINVFFDANCLPYKDVERQVHFPITGSAFLGASNTTKIRFYFDRIGNSNTTWVAVAKLPNGKQGSKVLSISEDSELGENYAELELDSWYTQAKGDVYIALQGYQGGVEYSYDSETELYEITGTPTIQTTGSIKLAINYAPIGQVADYNDEFTTYQEILAALGDKADITNTIIVVNDITQVVATTYEDGQIFYNLADRKLYQLDNSSFVVFQPYVVLNAPAGTLSVETYNLLLEHPEYPIVLNNYVFWLNEDSGGSLFYFRHYNQKTNDIVKLTQCRIGINKSSRAFIYSESSFNIYDKSKTDDLLSGKADKSTTYTKTETDDLLSGKQNTLVSGTNIKSLTVDGVEKSLLGSGTIEVGSSSGGGAWGEITGDIQDQTDLQAEFQDIREVAEGKNRSIVVSYTQTAPTNDTQAQTYKKPDGTAFTSLSDFTTYINGKSLLNSLFNSQSADITHGDFYIIANDKTVYTNTYIVNNFKVGDIVLITQTDVPDRWIAFLSSGTYDVVSFYKLETTKIDLTNYATTGDLSTARYQTELMLAPEYNILTTYAVGDKVVHDHKLYTCTTAITTPESWDSTHWSQISVASGFVDLDKAQVISGVKTHTADLELETSDSNTPILSFKNQYATGEIRMSAYNFTISHNLIPKNGTTPSLGTSVFPFQNLYLSGTAYVYGKVKLSNSSNVGYQLGNRGDGYLSIYNNNGNIVYDFDNLGLINRSGQDLGSNSYKWKDLYLSGSINKNSSNYGLTLPDTTNFTANKEIATTDQAFNVINASDITSNTLTQAQYDLITNGKPTLISGTFGTRTNILIVGLADLTSSFRGIAISGYEITTVFIDASTKQINIDYSQDIQLKKIALINTQNFNGKTVPSYPSNANWKGEWVGTQAEYNALSTYDSNTTYYIIEE